MLLPRFLLPRLHIGRLRSQTSVRKVMEALHQLPTKLDGTYEDAMLRIKGQVKEYSQLAFKALSWISKTFRPLKLDDTSNPSCRAQGSKIGPGRRRGR
jgi:hypothetical protein